MKKTIVLSILAVIAAVCSFGCGGGRTTITNNGANNSNKSVTSVNSNAAPTAASNSATGGKTVDINSVAAGDPYETIKKFHSLAESGKAAEMTKLFSEKAIQKRTAAEITTSNKGFSDLAQQLVKATKTIGIFKATETIDNDTAELKYTYGDPSTGSGLKTKCRLVKEKGEWKIDEINEDR